MFKLIITFAVLFCAFFVKAQNQPDRYIIFDDTLRFKVESHMKQDTVDYETFKNYTNVKVVEMNKKGKEIYLPVVNGEVWIPGVLEIGKIDSTGTILLRNRYSTPILHYINGRRFHIVLRFQLADGYIWTSTLPLFGKP